MGKKSFQTFFASLVTFRFAVFIHLSSLWVSSLVPQTRGFTLLLYRKPKYSLGQRTKLITDIYNDIHHGWKTLSGDTIKCSVTLQSLLIAKRSIVDKLKN